MFEREARWIADRLAAYPPSLLSPLLNVGSGTGAFRETVCDASSNQPDLGG